VHLVTAVLPVLQLPVELAWVAQQVHLVLVVLVVLRTPEV
jgi:hypothetical protein